MPSSQFVAGGKACVIGQAGLVDRSVLASMVACGSSRKGALRPRLGMISETGGSVLGLKRPKPVYSVENSLKLKLLIIVTSPLTMIDLAPSVTVRSITQ